MLVELKRKPSTTQGTFGQLYIDGHFFCYTLERPYVGEHPCIEAGTYQCDRYHSPHRNDDCWLLQDVAGRTAIEIHSANVYTELLGCIAPGKDIGVLDGIPAVLGSKTAMVDLYKAVGDHFKIVITW